MRTSKPLRPIPITYRLGSSVLLLIVAFLFRLPLAAQNAGQMQNEKMAERGSMTVPGRRSFTITKPQDLDVPEPRAQVLHKVVQEVVADYLHVRLTKETPPLVLVLGEEREHFTFGGLNQVDTIYLQRWNEAKFVASDVSLAVQHLVSAGNLGRIAEEISRRSDRLLPVSLDQLRKGGVSQPIPRLPAMGNRCIAAMTDASDVGVRCERRAAPLP